MKPLQAAAPWIAGSLVWFLAAWLRVRGTAMARVLWDQMGPWWVAAGGPPWSAPHADLFGWGLYLPYWILMGPADSLWTAVQVLILLHAGVAPLAFLAGGLLARQGGSWLGAWVVGLAVALDPGLIDTALSGSKAYLAAFWISAMCLGLCAGGRKWGPMLALGSLAMAGMNHPLAFCALPLLGCLPWKHRRRCGWALVFGCLLLVPSLVWTLSHELPGSGGLEAPVSGALVGMWDSGPLAVVLALVGLGAGLSRRSSRGLSIGTIASLLLLLGIGAGLGYLRDYHLRILLVPALLGWAAIPRFWSLASLLCLRIPAHPIDQASAALRPGGLGLAHQFSKSLRALPDPILLIDGALISSEVAVEPAAMTFDLWLGGRDAQGFGLGDAGSLPTQVVLIVSAERGEGRSPGDIDMALEHWDADVLVSGDRYFLAQGSMEKIRSWSAAICQNRRQQGKGLPRFGGAWDGLIVLQPELESEDLEAWWDCP